MHKVTFTLTSEDRLAGYRVGLAHMSWLYSIVQAGCFLLLIAGFTLVLVSKGYTLTWPLRAPSRLLLLSAAPLVLIPLCSFLFVNVMQWMLSRHWTIMIEARHLTGLAAFGSYKIAWKRITDCLDTRQHYCFCHNSGSAVVVPKSAFADSEMAAAFFHEARQRWRHATGRADGVPPNTPGVWPPAPYPTDSQEPGGAGGR